jgi:hypothetical protein
MKKLLTLCLGLVAALAIQAQSDFPLQFADKDGNMIADGTTLNITSYEADAFGDIIMPSKLYVKNTSASAVQGGGTYTIQSMGNGVFQTCFPANCVRQTKVGAYTTEDGEFAAGVLKDMQTEWFPAGEGSCQVTYQLVTFKQNPITKKWTKDKSGPTVTLNFTYSTTGIGSAVADKQVRQVEYYSLTGRRVQVPSNGVYIVRKTYSDGTVKSFKIKK